MGRPHLSAAPRTFQDHKRIIFGRILIEFAIGFNSLIRFVRSRGSNNPEAYG